MAKAVSLLVTVILTLTISASNKKSVLAQLSTATPAQTTVATTASKYDNISTTFASLSTTTQASPASGSCPDYCCQYDHNEQQKSIKHNVDAVFSQRQQIDLIFIIKNSQGFLATRLKQVLSFVSNLVTYLQLQGYLIVHPEYGRVAILTFADNLPTPVVDGINAQTGSAYNDACKLQSYINNIRWNDESKVGNSLYIVLQQAQQIFISSQRNATRVVFYFDNGANWLTDDATKLADLLSNLRIAMNVHIFAAGVGVSPDGWMTESQMEHNVQGISSGISNYYACMEDWSVAISNALNKTLLANTQGNTTVPSQHLYTVSPISTSQCQQLSCANNSDNNPSCGCSNPNLDICACNVISQQYVCQACQVLYPCTTTTTTSTTTVTPGPILTTTYIIIIAAGGGGLLIIIIIVIIIVACCCCKKREKEHPAPMPPPPRKRRQNNCTDKVVDGSEENFYGNATSNSKYDVIQEDAMNTPSTVAIETMQAAKRDALERGMPGWQAYLTESATCLTHLCIIGLSGTRYAQTSADHFVRTREARAIHALLLLRPANRRKATTVRVAGTDYIIDWDGSKPVYSNTTSPSSIEGQGQAAAMLRAWRLLTSHSEQREVVLACSAHNYVAVGISMDMRENDCAEAVSHMIDHVAKLNFEDDPDADVYAVSQLQQRHTTQVKKQNAYVDHQLGNSEIYAPARQGRNKK